MASTTTNIAIEQDNLIAAYKNGQVTISQSQLNDLQRNAWINASYILAPNNLVIRQFCLIDVFKGSPDNKDKIRNQLDQLSYTSMNPEERIWAEGYSYWIYTRAALDIWVERFKAVIDLTYIQSLITDVDSGFRDTAYLRNGVYYPTPFGDLRDEPLVSNLQDSRPMISTQCKIVNLVVGQCITYYITASPIGLNTHVPKTDSMVSIVNGIPTPFTFYQGYDKKYSSVFQQIADTVSIWRVLSLLIK
jgi:hypothetical protein